MTTPVRQQYLDQKARHPDAILLFRLGDFYETFDEDAELVARELNITLTSKPMGAGVRVPLAGVPVVSVDQHLSRLIQLGHRVAICEQLEDPRASRGLVKRGVVRVLSPGTALEPALLEAGRPSACAAAALRRGRRRTLRLGLAAADISTGAFATCELSYEWGPGEDIEQAAAVLWAEAADELARHGVRELLVSESLEHAPPPSAAAISEALASPQPRPEREFRPDHARRALARRFAAGGEASADAAYGLDERPAALAACGALLAYLERSLPDAENDDVRAPDPLSHLAPPRLYETDARLQWDAATQRALALVDPGAASADSASTDAAPRTLLDVVDRCATHVGRRWLRASLLAPLLSQRRIERRLDRVEALLQHQSLRRTVANQLKPIPDLERLLGRAGAGLARPPELAALARGLLAAEELAASISGEDVAAPVLQDLAARLGPAPDGARALADALLEQPAAEYGAGIVRNGVDAVVDRAAACADDAQQRLSALEERLREETELPGLRVGFHRTFGHFIELPRGQAANAPESWQRRQTLRDRERFTEPRLREIATDLEAAEQDLTEAERDCVERLRAELVAEAGAIRERAGALARLDAAAALASVAAERRWTRPQLQTDAELRIVEGRHPVVEAAAAQGAFVPNDVHLHDSGEHAPQLLLVTGPNMAGKSTYLRQTALIAALAQAGSFVPAAEARLGLVDRIYARVGAHDDLAAGRSTFLVEMLETARLLHGAGDRSLILLDEIGRGTATWDGLAIAQAVVEELAGGLAASARSERGPRTLFATHFHELTALAGTLPRVGNAAVQVDEDDDGRIRFLHRVEAGAADRSYGVQVAAAAGLPPRVIERAGELLASLEAVGGAPPPAPAALPQLELLRTPPLPILHDLAALDIDGITPLEAITALYALREQARTELRAYPTDEPLDEPTFPFDLGAAGG